MARMSDIRKKAIGTPPVDNNATADTASEPEVKLETGAADALKNTASAGVDAPSPAEEEMPPVVSRELQQWVVFQCAGVHYALKSEQVRLIEMLGEITSVPNTPPAVAGVFNLRGEIVPVIDLRARLGLPPAPYSLAARIIILQASKRRVGMIVDSAREVLRIAQDKVLPPSEFMQGLSGRYLTGIIVQAERTILILDLEHVLRVEEPLQAISSSIPSQHEE